MKWNQGFCQCTLPYLDSYGDYGPMSVNRLIQFKYKSSNKMKFLSVDLF